jgi:hypothetical protein
MRGEYSHEGPVMSRKTIVAITVAGLVVLGGAGWLALTREEWGPFVADDPNYRSGRRSVCHAPPMVGEPLAFSVRDSGLRPRARGFERLREYTFAAAARGGVIRVCSEYGSVRVTGSDDGKARVQVVISSPFPAGDRAIDDTDVSIDVRESASGIVLAIWQRTQGVTAFRSFVRRGARPAAVNVRVELPRQGVYELALVANHQRMTVSDLDVKGTLEGYASPGVTLDAGLAGSLRMKVSGVSYGASLDGGEADLAGGTTVTLRPLQSTTVDLETDQAELRATFVGDDLGLEVLARAPEPPTVDIGPTESLQTGAVRDVGFVRATRQIVVRARNGSGRIVVARRSR